MKHLSKKENRRRYRLHHTIKAAFHYHPKLKIIESDGRTKASAKVQRAVDELRTRFGYSVQATIPSIAQGDKARIHPKYQKQKNRGMIFEVVEIRGKQRR